MALVDSKSFDVSATLASIEALKTEVDSAKQDHSRLQGQKDQIWSSLKADKITTRAQLDKKIDELCSQRDKLIGSLRTRFAAAAKKYGWQ